ncbi:hypothetical protein [Streptomyces sp. NPDC050355]|uniref:Uncharacterized protein n=1 Tax=Streptomyces sirii TaxID=3127701 RepID=A0ABZ2R0N7_9ACTN
MEQEADRAKRPAGPEMPRQAPPIDRTTSATAGAYDDTAGVEPNGFLTDMLARVLPI